MDQSDPEHPAHNCGKSGIPPEVAPPNQLGLKSSPVDFENRPPDPHGYGTLDSPKNFSHRDMVGGEFKLDDDGVSCSINKDHHSSTPSSNFNTRDHKHNSLVVIDRKQFCLKKACLSIANVAKHAICQGFSKVKAKFHHISWKNGLAICTNLRQKAVLVAKQMTSFDFIAIASFLWQLLNDLGFAVFVLVFIILRLIFLAMTSPS